MFNSLSLARRLSFGFISVLVLLLAIAISSAYALRLLGNSVEQIVQVDNLKTRLANELMGSISELAIRARSVTLFTQMDRKALDLEMQSAKAAMGSFAKTETALAALLTSGQGNPQEVALMADISKTAKTVFPEVTAALAQADDGDTVAAVLSLMNRVRPAELELRSKVNSLIDLQSKLTELARIEAQALQREAFVVESVLAISALILGGVIAWRITISVTAPVARAVVVAERIAMGDLSSQVEVRIFDETGRLLQAIASMQDRLKGLVGGIRQSAESIKVASAEVASGNLDLSNRTEEAASSLQDTAHSMESLTSIVAQTAQSARKADQLASSAAQVAARGGAVVSEVVSTMGEINASSSRIADIIAVIDGIAFQTNILALNAAVEAARAGEQGRGFAVVASEVRTLAGRSAEAAKEIKVLINASVERVERGTRLVADAGKTMREIVDSVQLVTTTIGEITASATEQSEGINRINAAISALDGVTQQNSALVEEGAAAAESLKDQAGSLSDAVSTFKLDRKGLADSSPVSRQLSIGRA
ncbi:MAG: methyl-accepting chemotaxis protein [Pseudomonadota bacterium]